MESNVPVEDISRELGPGGPGTDTIRRWWLYSRPQDPANRPQRTAIPHDLLQTLQALRRDVHPYGPHIDNEVIAQALIWKRAGISTLAITQETGYGKSTINKWWYQYQHLVPVL